MENNNFSCFDANNISRISVTPEYWQSISVSQGFYNGAVATATVMLLAFLIGLPGNIILIASIIKLRLYCYPTHILLLNLGISDLLVCLVVLPFTFISGFAGDFIFGESDYARCKVCQAGLIYIALSVFSLNTLGLISVDRFIYIKFPLKYNKIVTMSNTIIIVCVIWILSIIQSLLPLVGFGEIRFTYSTSTCSPYFLGRTHITRNIYYIVFLLSLGSLPVLSIIVTNIWVVYIVWHQLKEIYRTRGYLSNMDELRRHSVNIVMKNKKYTKQLALIRVFGAILVANAISWTPLILHTIVLTFNGSGVPFGFYIFVYLTFASHSVFHPLIEGYFIPEIRSSFRTVFKFIFCLEMCRRKPKIRFSSSARNFIGNEESIITEFKTGCCQRGCLDICNFAMIPHESEVSLSALAATQNPPTVTTS